MDTLERPTNSRFASAMDRWKRGAGVALLVAIMVVAAMLPAALVGLAAAFLGADEYVVGTLALFVTIPWMLSEPELLRSIARLANTRD